jgi:hypothetical protein
MVQPRFNDFEIATEQIAFAASMFAAGCFKHKISDRDFGRQRLITASNKERE